MRMSGSAFDHEQDIPPTSGKNVHKVPLVVATEDTFKDYGRLVRNFEEEEVWIATWPQQGRRPVRAGTGIGGGVTSGVFIHKWQGRYLHAYNEAVGGKYIIGCLPTDVTESDRNCVLVRDANYHPDGGQVFYPDSVAPFVMVLALPGDDVTPEDFVAFYCDGSFGAQIKPGIWHQSMYPLAEEALFQGKQGQVHACVDVDTVDEFGKYLLVPLKQ